MSEFAGMVADGATTVMNVLGSPGAGLANALDSIVPVLPSEIILPIAGFAAGRGQLNLLAVIAWTTAGSIAGSLVVYHLGALLGRDRLRRSAVRLPLVTTHDLDRAEAWFARHGRKTVLLGRMLPVFRVFISVPAGIERMPVPVFVAYTGVGSLLWNTAFVLAGYQLGENWERVSVYVGPVSEVVVGLVVLAIAYFVCVRAVRSYR